ncbi:MAG: ATP-binding protein [bacterium]
MEISEIKDKATEKNTANIVGRVVATEKKPNTAQSFSFWTNLDSPVGIGTIVKVISDKKIINKAEEAERIIYGIVTDGISYTDLAEPIHDYISSDYDPEISIINQTERPEIRYYTASVLKMVPEEPVQPVSVGSVYLADDEAVRKSLRMDKYAEETGIPIGLYINGDNQSPIYLDSKFLLGPEAAHLNVTGVSGLATKTSIIEFILNSIFQYYNEEGGIAAVLFNVKGCDLLYLDQKAEDLSEDDLKMYKKLKIEPKSFENVEYYAPYKDDGVNLNTLRTHEDLKHNVNALSWGLKEIIDNVQVVLNKDDVDAKADAFLQLINERIINTDKPDKTYKVDKKIENFIQLEEWFKDIFDELEGEGSNGEGKSQWRGHAHATIRKIYNRLKNITLRCKGLVRNDSYVSDLPWGSFKDRTVYVVDVAQVIPLAQDLIFTRAVEKLREQLERGVLGVKKVVVFVDELNKYASSDSGNSYLKQTLLEISERGRYLGLILFSAQQFKSQVHKRIVGNCGTSIYGRMDMDELATQGYGVMPSTVKAELTVLEKGKLLIRHPHFNQYVFVRFPKPAVMTSQDGKEKFKPVPERSFEDAMIYNFKRLDKNIKENDIKDAIFGIDKEEIIRAFNETEQKGRENPLGYFKKVLRKSAPRVSFEDSFSPSPVSGTLDDWLRED